MSRSYVLFAQPYISSTQIPPAADALGIRGNGETITFQFQPLHVRLSELTIRWNPRKSRGGMSLFLGGGGINVELGHVDFSFHRRGIFNVDNHVIEHAVSSLSTQTKKYFFYIIPDEFSVVADCMLNLRSSQNIVRPIPIRPPPRVQPCNTLH